MKKETKVEGLVPILKWAGGKRQLLNEIIPKIPKYTTYYEPFIGGAAVLFAIQPKKAVINDFNSELINLYLVIKDNPDELISILKKYNNLNDKDFFYKIRALDRDATAFALTSNVERAARTIYLNRTCYNGLYRVNSTGNFNAPWGYYQNPNIVNEEVILKINDYFNKANIKFLCGNYSKALPRVNSGSFVYLDPPYMPISVSSSFTNYTPEGFGKEQQVSLKEYCDKLNKKGVKFLLSNSNCDFIESLYKDYIIERVSVKRNINSKADKRNNIKEVLIRNYNID